MWQNNLNTVTLLEGIKLQFPEAKITQVIGATTLDGGQACGGRDGFETIFRHHFGPPASGGDRQTGATKFSACCMTLLFFKD